MAKKERYKTIDDRVGRLILAAAHRYPTLGRKRLWALLLEDGVDVDPLELKHFLRERGISRAQPGPSPQPGGEPADGFDAPLPELRRGRSDEGRSDR